MKDESGALSRRRALQLLGASAASLGAAGLVSARAAQAGGPEASGAAGVNAGAAGAAEPTGTAVATAGGETLPPFTGPEASSYWSATGPYVTYPQKLPLIMLTDRPVQLETPRPYFASPITPTAAFYVRWHLDGHPPAVNLARWRLRVEGAVAKVLDLSLADLQKFPEVTVAAANQCSGNSRSRLQPRVPGSQWGNGGMGCAYWTGVRLRDVLKAAGINKGAVQVQVQFEGSERGKGPPDKGAYVFAKSLDLENPVMDEIILAYGMNGEPLPLLHGFPLRVVVPGYFATYWVKALGVIRILDKVDEGYWMKTAYRMPDTPRGSVTPEQARAGNFTKSPIGRMPVRSFLVAPDGQGKLPAGVQVTLQGIAFSGYGGIKKVELSLDGGATWVPTELGPELGKYSFRSWTYPWRPKAPGEVTLAVRATDTVGNTQLDRPLWNPGGYGWSCIEKQIFIIGPAS